MQALEELGLPGGKVGQNWGLFLTLVASVLQQKACEKEIFPVL